MPGTPREASLPAAAAPAAGLGAVAEKTIALAITAAVVAAVIRFPLDPWLVGAGLVLYAGLLYRWPRSWIFCIPVALPLLDVTMWSGWFFLNTVDLMVLTTVAVLLWRAESGFPNAFAWPEILIPAMVLSVGLSALVGLWPPPPITVNAFAQYISPYNALRVAKGLIWAALLYRHLKKAMDESPWATRELLLAGISTGVIGVGLVVLWERGVFLAIANWKSVYSVVASVLDFTTPYRATGPFSSMHTGGAPLDGFLGLTLPFALGAVFISRLPAVRAIGLAAVGLGLYAIAVTFSRGVYLGGGIGVAAFFGGLFICWNHYLRIPGRYVALGLGLLVLLGVLFYAAFERGGAITLFLGVAAFFAASAAGYLTRGRSLALTLAAAAVVAAGTSGMTYDALSESRWHATTFDAAVIFAAVYGVALAFLPALIARRVLTPATVKIASLLFVVVLVLEVGAVQALSGYRMEVRFSQVSGDLDTRIAHWRDALAMMTPDPVHRLFGMGTGSFPRNYFLHHLGEDDLATYEYASEDGVSYLRLGWGQFNIMQKVRMQPHTTYTLHATLRGYSSHRAGLTVKICYKHILYSERYTPNCVVVYPRVKSVGQWEDRTITFNSGTLGSDGFLYWPVAVMLFNGSAREKVDVAHLDIIGPDGRNLLANGDFNNGGDHWIFVSDFHHLPWHAKNIFLHVFFEQGWFGLVVVFGAFLVAMARQFPAMTAGNELAVVLFASMLAFLTVGLFGSLLDSPRLATLAYLIVFVALFRRPGAPPSPSARRRSQAR